jgi:hypothetical protein
MCEYVEVKPNIGFKISKEKDDLDKLVAEIDMILSEINSKTEIEVEI